MATRTGKKSYPQMLEDLQLLQQQAEAQRAKDVEVVIARIREAMAFWGITEEDLGFAKRPPAASPPPAPAPAKKKRKSRYTERPLAGPVKR